MVVTEPKHVEQLTQTVCIRPKPEDRQDFTTEKTYFDRYLHETLYSPNKEQ